MDDILFIILHKKDDSDDYFDKPSKEIAVLATNISGFEDHIVYGSFPNGCIRVKESYDEIMKIFDDVQAYIEKRKEGNLCQKIMK